MRLGERPHIARECNRNIRLTMAPVFLASLLCVGGVLSGNFAFAHARVLHVLSMVTGVGAAMLPLLTHGQGPKRADRPPLPREPTVEAVIEDILIA